MEHPKDPHAEYGVSPLSRCQVVLEDLRRLTELEVQALPPPSIVIRDDGEVEFTYPELSKDFCVTSEYLLKIIAKELGVPHHLFFGNTLHINHNGDKIDDTTR